MDEFGKLLPGAELPFSLDEAKRLFTHMVQVAAYDSILYDVQRQGRISFYMQNLGEEALQIGTASALSPEDVVWPQYRELGLFLVRGFTVEQMLDQCFSNKDEPGKGRQMPIHYCAAELNIQAITSPLATGIPHAAGAGRAFALDGVDRCGVTYFGDGAASEGDFAVAINFAAVLNCQSIFICRNNGYAISTHVDEQYAGDGIAARGLAYGLETIRVDGNDLIACYVATKKAREIAVQGRPVLIELMTYRMGHHSTSDDAGKYRVKGEAEDWEKPGIEPISRMKAFLIDAGVLTEQEFVDLKQSFKDDLMAKMKVAEKKKLACIDDMFADVYDVLPWHLEEQRAEVWEHINKHPGVYDLEKYEKSPFQKI